MNVKPKFIKLILQSFIVLGLTRSSLFVTAQEMGINLNSGIAGLHYTVPNGLNNQRFGEGIGVYFSNPLKNKNWGIISGINAQYFSSKSSLNDNAGFTTLLVDDFNTAFEYQISATNYQEQQKFWAFTIPLLLSYEKKNLKKSNWYLNAGGKFLIPTSLQTKISADKINLYGYYPNVNALITNLPQHGFGSLSNWSSQNNISILKPSLLLSAESGVKYKLSDKCQLYIGVYIDYGLTNTTKPSADGSLVSYS